MNVYQFITEAETMRKNGGICVVGYAGPKRQAERHRKLTNAYSALWGFSIKHPDSTRQRSARQRDLQLWMARMEKSNVRQIGSI